MEMFLKVIRIPWNAVKLVLLFIAHAPKKVLVGLLICFSFSSIFLILQLRQAQKKLSILESQNSGLIDELGQVTEKNLEMQSQMQALSRDTTQLKDFLRIPSPTPS